MSQRIVRLPLWLTCLALALSLVIGGVTGSFVANPSVFASSTAAEAQAMQATFAPVIQKVMPSVVNIFSTKNIGTDRNLEPFFSDPFFRRFFKDDFWGTPAIPRERQERSLGSGVIVSPEGHILTNDHVVDGATEVKVLLSDKRELTARIVGRDSKTDLAVPKIDETALPAVSLGDSTKVQVGDVVFAIGNPFGVGQTVTMDLVSAIGRGGLGIEEYEDFIQTDAAINPGNSGGALINAQGEVIGINTAILSRSGGNQGVGFAIPVNMARNVMDQIIHDGKVSRAFLGVMIQPVTPDVATAFKLSKSEGALISDVSANSPAETAGLKAGDVVTKVDGQTIIDSRALQLMIGQMKPGRTVRLSVIRDGVERQHSVTLGEQRGGNRETDGKRNGTSADRVLEGVSVETLTPEVASEFGIARPMRGVVVLRVDPDSSAADAGLESRDVILEVNRRPVTTVNELQQYINDSNSDSTILFVNRDGRMRYVVISSD